MTVGFKYLSISLTFNLKLDLVDLRSRAETETGYHRGTGPNRRMDVGLEKDFVVLILETAG